MTLPTTVKTWTITPNNRIPYVSLSETMQRYLHGVKTFLKAGGYTVKGSASNGTGAMDAVDRWTSISDVTPRGAASGNSQAWIVLTDGNGCDLLLTYQGATDDVARISFSIGGLFVAAGTPQNQPTATDEAVLTATNTLIGTNTTGDRMWFGWRDSQHKLCRFAIARAGVFLGRIWGLELVTSLVSGGVITWPTPVWGFAMAQGQNFGQNIGVTKVSAGVINVFWGVEMLSNSTTVFGAVKNELQGAKGYPVMPLSIGSATTGSQGVLGDLFDQWIGRPSGGADGDLYGNRQFIGLGGFNGTANGCGLWPWDGTNDAFLT